MPQRVALIVLYDCESKGFHMAIMPVIIMGLNFSRFAIYIERIPTSKASFETLRSIAAIISESPLVGFGNPPVSTILPVVGSKNLLLVCARLRISLIYFT